MSVGRDADLDSSVSIAHDIGQATAELRAEHRQETTTLQQAVDHVTTLVGWPGFVAVLAVAIGLWIVANTLAIVLGAKPADSPPFFWLQGAITTGALFVAALILATQRSEDKLARHRSQLILELLLLNDQKISKIIELSEEVRRDNPSLQNRVDDQAIAMSTPSDAHSVSEAIKGVQAVAD